MIKELLILYIWITQSCEVLLSKTFIKELSSVLLIQEILNSIKTGSIPISKYVGVAKVRSLDWALFRGIPERQVLHLVPVLSTACAGIKSACYY